MENKAEEIIKKYTEKLHHDGKYEFIHVKVDKAILAMKEYASQQKPEIIKSDNSKVNTQLLEDVEILKVKHQMFIGAMSEILNTELIIKVLKEVDEALN